MIRNKETPEVHTPSVPNQLNIGNATFIGKDTIYFNSRTCKRVYELLLSGNKYSVVQLTNLLKIPDPRSNIRYLRNAGVPIADYWVKSEYSRYKVYFIHQG